MIALRLPAIVEHAFRALVFLVAVSAFAWVAAYWVWRITEPKATSVLVQQETDWSARILAGDALGFTLAEPPPVSQSVVPGLVETRFKLMGIARSPGTAGRTDAQALFKVDNRRILWLRVGEALEPGVALTAIEANAVRLARDGKEVRLLLRETTVPATRSGSAINRSIATRETVPASTTTACKLAPEQRGRAYVLRPEIVDGVMRERSGWADLFKPTAEGVQVQNPGGTGAMLGLYSNDLLSKADGAQLGGADDVLRLILQPLARNGSVIVTGSRGGQPREWIYAGMGCLPR